MIDFRLNNNSSSSSDGTVNGQSNAKVGATYKQLTRDIRKGKRESKNNSNKSCSHIFVHVKTTPAAAAAALEAVL